MFPAPSSFSVPRVDERRLCLVDGAPGRLRLVVTTCCRICVRYLSRHRSPVNADFESGFGADIGGCPKALPGLAV